MQITEEARRAAAIAVAVEVNGWPGAASLPYHPTDPTVADTMRRITDVALEAAAPLIAPQPVDREALAGATHRYFCLARGASAHPTDADDYDKADEILEILALITGTES